MASYYAFGGEAFVRRDIVEIAAMFARATQLRRYQIPTSGFNTDLILDRELTSLASSSSTR